jgi:hypothetical protein
LQSILYSQKDKYLKTTIQRRLAALQEEFGFANVNAYDIYRKFVSKNSDMSTFAESIIGKFK